MATVFAKGYSRLATEVIGPAFKPWRSEYVFGASGPAIGDILVLAPAMHPAYQLADYHIICEDLDSNGVPTIAFTVGALNSASSPTDLAASTYASFDTGVSIGQTGGMFRATSGNHFLFSDRDKMIGIKWTAAAATWAGNGKKLVAYLQYLPK